MTGDRMYLYLQYRDHYYHVTFSHIAMRHFTFLPLMPKSSQQHSVRFALTPSYHYFSPGDTSESNVATGPHHSGAILTLSAIERAIAAPLPSMYFLFFSSFLIECL